jgi:hypothetical protein
VKVKSRECSHSSRHNCPKQLLTYASQRHSNHSLTQQVQSKTIAINIGVEQEEKKECEKNSQSIEVVFVHEIDSSRVNLLNELSTTLVFFCILSRWLAFCREWNLLVLVTQLPSSLSELVKSLKNVLKEEENRAICQLRFVASSEATRFEKFN